MSRAGGIGTMANGLRPALAATTWLFQSAVSVAVTSYQRREPRRQSPPPRKDSGSVNSRNREFDSRLQHCELCLTPIPGPRAGQHDRAGPLARAQARDHVDPAVFGQDLRRYADLPPGIRRQMIFVEFAH
jgi:hypothetical protein